LLHYTFAKEVLILAHSKRKSTKETITKVTLMVGCLLFMGSAIFPFYYIFYFVSPHHMPEGNGGEYLIYYWSFRTTSHFSPKGWLDDYVTDYWFYDNGFYEYVPGPTLSWVFILMLAAQVLTLVIGIASIFITNRLLALFPIVTCATVIGLMIYAIQVLLKSNFALTPHQPGYWLTYPSILLFLLAFVLKQI
jgi:hypothetical protein